MVCQPAWILESCSRRKTVTFTCFFASYLPIIDEDDASCNIGMITLITAFMLHIQSNLSGVTQGKDKKWLFKTGDPLYRLICTIFWFTGPRKGGCLRQVIP